MRPLAKLFYCKLKILAANHSKLAIGEICLATLGEIDKNLLAALVKFIEICSLRSRNLLGYASRNLPRCRSAKFP